MIQILLGDAAPVARLEWSIYKGASGVKEDFTNASVFLWLIGCGNKFLVECTAENGVIKTVIPRTLPEGVYDLRAMWVKDDNCCKRCMSEVEKVFGITYDPEQASPVVGDTCTIKVKSCAATYGYDGLSAYEMAVLKGKTTLSEEEWLNIQNATAEDLERLQQEVDAIVVGSAEVALSTNPSVIFVGTPTDVVLEADTNIYATDIKIKKGDAVLGDGQGTALSATDRQVSLDVTGSVEYLAKFVISGLEKTASKLVNVVNKIYYGSGAVYTDASEVAPAKVSAAGYYYVRVQSEGQHVFFNVPASMDAIRAKMSGFDFPLETPVNVVIDGAVYKSYRSSNTYDAGNYELVIENI